MNKIIIWFFVFIWMIWIVFANQNFVILNWNETKIDNWYEITNTKGYKIFAPYTDSDNNVLWNSNWINISKSLWNKLDNTYSVGWFTIKDAILEPKVICDQYTEWTLADGTWYKSCNNTIITDPDYNICTAVFHLTWFNSINGVQPWYNECDCNTSGTVSCIWNKNWSCSVTWYSQTFRAYFNNDCTITKITWGWLPSHLQNVSIPRGWLIGAWTSTYWGSIYNHPYWFIWFNNRFAWINWVYNQDSRCNAVWTFFWFYVPFKNGKCYYEKKEWIIVQAAAYWSPAIYDWNNYINSQCSSWTLNTLTRTFTWWYTSPSMTDTSLICIDWRNSPAPVSWICWSPLYTCSVWGLDNIPDSSDYFLRKCKWINGWFDASCRYSKIQEVCNETNLGLHNWIWKTCNTTTNKGERCASLNYTWSNCDQMWRYWIWWVFIWYWAGSPPTPRWYAYIWK